MEKKVDMEKVLIKLGFSHKEAHEIILKIVSNARKQ